MKLMMQKMEDMEDDDIQNFSQLLNTIMKKVNIFLFKWKQLCFYIVIAFLMSLFCYFFRANDRNRENLKKIPSNS